MAAQTVGTEDPTFTPLSASEGGPANPERPGATLKHSSRMVAGVPTDTRTDGSLEFFNNGIWIV